MLNKISPLGLAKLPKETYETALELANPDAILLRSFKMNGKMPATLKAIGRAGAGVNNIPVDACSEQGIVVFNTPGANANAVKELAILGLLISSRRIADALAYARGLAGKGAEISKMIEKDKSQFVGPELLGKKLGVIGLGAIGVMVANSALALGMDVEGFDPYISVEAAWSLSHDVKKARSLDALVANSDYITVHVPLSDKTKHLINAEKISLMKKGVRIVNLSRDALVDEAALIAALKEGKIAHYVSDFGNEAILQAPNVTCFPHLGASTPEAEDNCAIMVANQVRDFLENGNVTNSVNFPACQLERSGKTRISIINKNIPNMVGQFTTALADAKMNIAEMLNKSRGDYAYNIVDIDGDVGENVTRKLEAINGVIKVRIIKAA